MHINWDETKFDGKVIWNPVFVSQL